MPRTEEEEIAEIKNNWCLQLIYEERDMQKFWIHVLKVHSNLAKKAVKILLQFSTTYICKASISAMLNLKTKKRGNLKILDGKLQVALSSITLNIKRLCYSHQPQISH